MSRPRNEGRDWAWLCGLTILFLASSDCRAAELSVLAARGYTAIPVPQRVTLGARVFQFGQNWQLELDRSVTPDDVAIVSLKDELLNRYRLSLSSQRRGRAEAGVLHLAVAPGSVALGEATDRSRDALAEQAYKLTLAPDRVNITANAATGLFYGVQTLVQLLKPQQGGFWLPEGEITDWPDLELRTIYWDDAHHLEHLDVLKRAVRQAAFFKINGFAVKLEGHFQYKSATPIVEPYALAPAELQEVTDDALRYHVQLIPFLDGPAHVAFILKHPEYAALREYPESNYEFCATNPGTYKLLFGMYDDLLEASRGGKYFMLSTDEPYYIGLAKNAQCNEADRAQELGSVGKLLAEFVTKTANYLHDRGRTVLFWGEYPLKPEDIPSLPSHLVNGEVYGPGYDSVFKAQGIRQLIYTSTQGEEPLFPNYYHLPPAERLHAGSSGPGRVAGMLEHITQTSARQEADLMGTFVAGWADAGLHPETFWLGYATGPAAAWNASSADPQELMSSFYKLFYGPGAVNMGRLYQLMSEQAEFWDDSWETVSSAARTPLFGDSDRVFDPPRPIDDQTLPLLPAPSPELLVVSHDWTQENARRLGLAEKSLAENDELLDLLHTNLQRVERNQYNLEVFISVAQLYRQNLLMLLSLGQVNGFLQAAQAAAGRGEAKRAVGAIDRALDTVDNIRWQRNAALANATATWYKSWLPRVAEANGRRYLDRVDDVKDHRPVRTIDMSYLAYRELLLPMGDWAAQTLAARNQYAQAHGLPTRAGKLDWKDTREIRPMEIPGDD